MRKLSSRLAMLKARNSADSPGINGKRGRGRPSKRQSLMALGPDENSIDFPFIPTEPKKIHLNEHQKETYMEQREKNRPFLDEDSMQAPMWNSMPEIFDDSSSISFATKPTKETDSMAVKTSNEAASIPPLDQLDDDMSLEEIRLSVKANENKLERDTASQRSEGDRLNDEDSRQSEGSSRSSASGNIIQGRRKKATPTKYQAEAHKVSRKRSLDRPTITKPTARKSNPTTLETAAQSKDSKQSSSLIEQDQETPLLNPKEEKETTTTEIASDKVERTTESPIGGDSPKAETVEQISTSTDSSAPIPEPVTEAEFSSPPKIDKPAESLTPKAVVTQPSTPSILRKPHTPMSTDKKSRRVHFDGTEGRDLQTTPTKSSPFFVLSLIPPKQPVSEKTSKSTSVKSNPDEGTILYEPLIDCKDPIQNIIHRISPHISNGIALKKALQAQGIKTIGDLAKCTIARIDSIVWLRKPRVENTRTVLVDYATKLQEAEAVVQQNLTKLLEAQAAREALPDLINHEETSKVDFHMELEDNSTSIQVDVAVRIETTTTRTDEPVEQEMMKEADKLEDKTVSSQEKENEKPAGAMDSKTEARVEKLIEVPLMADLVDEHPGQVGATVSAENNATATDPLAKTEEIQAEGSENSALDSDETIETTTQTLPNTDEDIAVYVLQQSLENLRNLDVMTIPGDQRVPAMSLLIQMQNRLNQLQVDLLKTFVPL